MKSAFLLIFLAGCTSQIPLAHYDSSLEALKVELADARRTQHAQETEIELLEESVRRQDPAKLLRELQALHKRIGELEKQQQQFAAKQEVKALEEEIHNQIHAVKAAIASVVELAQEVSQRSVTVQAGDTLEKIAKREGTTLSQLKKANSLSSDRIYVGQKLNIPS
ncbi:MAG: LysM peptidoglycan-binding domain-containing protein [Verrucomicrobia bacterium]|nr:LysM peptidoglycan-binding domain-containing protein [Verrucomicrobiota bacterium]